MPPLSEVLQSLQVYYLKCSVCHVEFLSRQEWFNHLVRENHQKLTKKDIEDDNLKIKLKEQCLVIFCKYSLTNESALKIINYFGKRREFTLVTDFVWWEDRPRLGIIQFESRKVAHEVLKEIEGSSGELLVDNQRIQVKGASELRELEWNAILPGSDPPSQPLVSKCTPETRVHSVDVGNQANNCQESYDDATSQQGDEPVDGTCPILILNKHAEENLWMPPEFKVRKLRVPEVKKYLCSVVLNGETYKPSWLQAGSSCQTGAKIKAAKFCLEILKSSPKLSQTPPPLPLPSIELKLTQFEESQLKPIIKLVRVPDLQYQKILEAVKTFENLLTRKDPLIRTIIFRNWYLQLKNSVSDKLLVFVYSEKEPIFINDKATQKNSCNFTWLPGKFIINCVMTSDENLKQQPFSCDKRLFPLAKDLTDTRLGCLFTHNKSQVSFEVVTHTKLIIEAQLCQLVKYICTFDPITIPLFTLVHYWAIVNNVQIGAPNVGPRKVSQSLPEPCTLEWLLITFLIQQGVVPSVREILERPHQKILEDGKDVGFDADPQFAMEWASKNNIRRNFADLLGLFRNFILFCEGILTKTNILVNPKDGEILDKQKFFTENETVLTKLTDEERLKIVNIQKYFTKVDLATEWPWYMIHPLEVTWRFSIVKGVPAMSSRTIVQLTVEKFRAFMKLCDFKGMETAFEGYGNLGKLLDMKLHKQKRKSTREEGGPALKKPSFAV